ncbi:TPA: restriction endonuclease [Serratia fonticola]
MFNFWKPLRHWDRDASQFTSDIIKYHKREFISFNNKRDYILNWKEYQEETAKIFRSLGCKAEVECKLAGVRGEHEIDVLVTFERFGVISTWVIECKYWNTAISKDKILTLQSIVDDVGADRGIFISKSGYQSGAFKQAEKSNITLTSLEELFADVSGHWCRNSTFLTDGSISASPTFHSRQ